MARGFAKALFFKNGKLEKKEKFEVEDGKVAMLEFVCYPWRIQVIGSYRWGAASQSLKAFFSFFSVSFLLEARSLQY